MTEKYSKKKTSVWKLETTIDILHNIYIHMKQNEINRETLREINIRLLDVSIIALEGKANDRNKDVSLSHLRKQVHNIVKLLDI